MTQLLDSSHISTTRHRTRFRRSTYLFRRI